LFFLIGCQSKIEKDNEKLKVNSLLKKADSLYKVENYREALIFYNKIVEINDEIPKVYYARSYCYAQMFEIQKSIDDNLKCIELNYRVEDSYLCIGLNYEILNDTKNALRYYEKVIELNPENKTANFRINSIRNISSN
jgi:tetratricopeptide (TPR) repeat protein